MSRAAPPSIAGLRTAVRLGPVALRSPIVLASGTWGAGAEAFDIVPLERIGALVPKGVTPEARAGNPPPRVVPAAAGMLNSVGLQNVGLEAFVRDKLPALRGLGPAVLVNLTGATVAEYGAMAARLAAHEAREPGSLAALELNVSCPNVKAGGAAFGTSPGAVAEVVRAARDGAPRLPLLVKMAPHAPDIVAVAAAAMDAGAAGLTIANTHPAVAIDAGARRPLFANVVAGLSGPAIKPLTLRLVWLVAEALPGAPILGLGGVVSGLDVVEFLLAGASAVGVGTASLAEPAAGDRVARELAAWCAAEGVSDVGELIRGAHTR